MVQETTQEPQARYAIVDHGGRQFRVEVGDILTVDRLDGEVGAKVDLGSVLLAQDGAEIRIGKPTLADARVEATVLGHERGDKILVFKFKKVKNYRRKRGHRQELTKVRVDSISF